MDQHQHSYFEAMVAVVAAVTLNAVVDAGGASLPWLPLLVAEESSCTAPDASHQFAGIVQYVAEARRVAAQMQSCLRQSTAVGKTLAFESFVATSVLPHLTPHSNNSRC